MLSLGLILSFNKAHYMPISEIITSIEHGIFSLPNDHKNKKQIM